MEMKKVVGDNATLPCHHQFPTSESLDIEWLLQKPHARQIVVRLAAAAAAGVVPAALGSRPKRDCQRCVAMTPERRIVSLL